MCSARTLAGSLVLAAALSAQAKDLGKVYEATLDFNPKGKTYDWTCEPSDVWALKSFAWKNGRQLRLELGASHVVFGKHAGNVVWAALFPTKPTKIKGRLPGSGERIQSIWMRFHPSWVGKLFPKKTVKGPGPAEFVWLGKRLYRGHINGGWQANNRPAIPKRNSIIFDVTTREATRRYYAADTDRRSVEYVGAFVNRAMSPLTPTTRKLSLSAFDEAWDQFDRNYAMFVIKPGVDWSKAKTRHRKAAAAARTTYETGIAIANLLAELEDLHIYVKVDEDYVPGHSRHRPLNGNWRATAGIIGKFEDTKHDLAWGRTADGIGYINVYALTDKELPRTFDAVLDKLSDTWGLVIDLRFNGGGGENLATPLAGRLIDKTRVYSSSCYRAGKRHDQLTQRYPRKCEPRGPWRYESPVIALWGQKTMSSAESFAWMLAVCPQVTTMGDVTAGASANPTLLELPGKITVRMPRWLDHGPDGKPFENVGIAPDVRLDTPENEFSDTSDPVIEAALERLREQPKGKRKPGKRR